MSPGSLDRLLLLHLEGHQVHRKGERLALGVTKQGQQKHDCARVSAGDGRVPSKCVKKPGSEVGR